MVVIDCAYPGCAFQSEDAPEAVACAILQSHAFSHAVPGPTFNRVPSEGPKLTRPSIDVGVSLEAWNVFTRRWQMFRQGSGINEASATAQLFQCASQSLGDSLLKSDAEIVSKPLQELLSAMRRLAVIPVATGVLRSDLMQMRQLRDEPLRAFAARVRGKADTCAFTIDCTCGLKINYTDHMIRDTLLNGIADDEIRREILGGADILTRAVNEIVALVESKEMARNAVPPTEVTSVSAVRRLHDADHRACRNATSCRESHNLPDRSKQSRCPLCQHLFQLYKKGPRGWNTKPYTLCIECYRSQKRRRRQLTHKVGPSPPEPGLQTLEVTSPADPQLSSIRTNHRPVSRHRPNKCNTPLSAVHRNATMQGPHYIFKDGQWATARMREHPKVHVTISVDRAQAHGESTSVRATNVTAIADTGSQVNVWSLDEFVKYGFQSDILTPASNLVAANHSSISIVGAFFAIIEGLSCHGYVVQCRAMVHISADIQTLLLSHETLSTLGVLSPSFPSLGEHAYAETQECAGEPAAITNAHLTRTVTGGCASPGDQNHSCTCPQHTASRHPATSEFFATISGAERDSIDSLEEALLASVRQNTRDQLTLNWDEIARHTASDAALNDLLSAIQSNFDVNLPPEGGIRQYLPYRDGFYISDGVILYNDRVVIPPQLRYQVLRTLHAAHQGVSAMERRARATVFWPGMTQDIHNIRDSCAHCNRNAPSQAATPPLPSHPPTTPFEKIFADYFDYAGRHFLIVGDRLSGWSDVFGTPAGTTVTGANALVRLLRSYFATFGVPEEISSDGGPEFTAFVTQDFMRKWDIKHRVSSAYFPQSNGRAEVAVKAAKRLLMSNISPTGDLNNDSFLRALLQLRNTPDPDCDLSPAEIVFGHPLRDAFSFVNRLATFSNRFIRRTWREAWRAKEDALRVRAKRTNEALSARTRSLRPLRCGDRVFIQNQGGTHPRKWDKVGTVVEALDFEMACQFPEGLILGRFSLGQLFPFFIPAVQCAVTCGQHS